MSAPALSIVIVGEADAQLEKALSMAEVLDVRRVAGLHELPMLCAERPADVILLAAMQPSSFDPAIMNRLRERDDALGRYTCVVQCLGNADSSAYRVSGVDDVLEMPPAAPSLRLALYARLAALESELRQFKPRKGMLWQDALTGLGNQPYLSHHLESLLLETRTRGGLACCALLSVDHLEHITDQYGQDARNDVLRGVAARLRKILRPTDLVARTGDKEFGIVLRYAEGGRLRPWVFERLLRAVSYPPFLLGGQEREITVSVGVCSSAEDGATTPAEMLAVAAAKMAEARAAGGNLLRL